MKPLTKLLLASALICSLGNCASGPPKKAQAPEAELEKKTADLKNVDLVALYALTGEKMYATAESNKAGFCKVGATVDLMGKVKVEYPFFYYVRLNGENFCELWESTGYYHDEKCDGKVDWYWKNKEGNPKLREGNEAEFEGVDKEYKEKALPFDIEWSIEQWKIQNGEADMSSRIMPLD